MSMFQIPMPDASDPNRYDFIQQADLDGSTYSLRFRWNGDSGGWYLDILAADKTPILCGSRLVVNFPIGSRFRDLGLPPGRIFALDTTGQGIDPGEEDLGTRVQVYYFDAAEPLGG